MELAQWKQADPKELWILAHIMNNKLTELDKTAWCFWTEATVTCTFQQKWFFLFILKDNEEKTTTVEDESELLHFRLHFQLKGSKVGDNGRIIQHRCIELKWLNVVYHQNGFI